MATSPQQQAASAVKSILTESLINKLQDPDPRDLLRILNSNVENPEVILILSSYIIIL